jgi:predicted transcriptional regulator
MAEQDQLITLTADIVSAHVSNNNVAVGDVAGLVEKVHAALAQLGAPPAAAEPEAKVPVVSVRASVKPDYLVCMECGKKQKTLRRHLQAAHGMTPAQYRQDYGLPDTYPMTAAAYSDTRRQMAKKIGLGRKAGQSRSAAPAASPAASKGGEGPKPRRGRKPKAG